MTGSVFERDRRIRDAKLSMGQTFYLVTLNQFIGKNADAWPSQITLAERMNASARAVRNWQNELAAMGVISVVSGKGCKTSNHYSLNLDVLPAKSIQKTEPRAALLAENASECGTLFLNNAELRAVGMRNELPTERTRKEKKKEHSVSEHFAEWYKAYPRKVGRAVAEKAYAKALKTLGKSKALNQLQTVELLLNAALEFAKSPAGNKGEYTPHPTTWLNQARYDDDRSEWANGSNDGRRPKEDAASSLFQQVVMECIRIRIEDPRYPQQLKEKFGDTTAKQVMALKVAVIKTAADSASRGNSFDLKTLEKLFNQGRQ